MSSLCPMHSIAQEKLAQRISISIHQTPLAQALTEIGIKGGFSFSYNTSIIHGDSVITLKAHDTSIRSILEKLLGDNYDFVESGRYIILLLKSPPPAVKSYTISGYIKEEDSQGKVGNVSIYENQQLVSTLTDTNGYFRLRLHDKYAYATLIISKHMYRDTLVVVRSGIDQQLDLTISLATITELPVVVVNRVEKTWVARFFLSSRQIVQSMNLTSFFTSKPVQLSLTPLLSTHGHMGAQIVNKLSLNVVGGYTAGVNGLELAGVFNIDKKRARYVQGAGVFNVVGGAVEGVQLAGIHNDDLDSLAGCQAAGISNRVKGPVCGVQLAGIANIAKQQVKGLQAAGIVNYAVDLRGVQIGIVNIADTSSGYMIGIFNFVRKGVHQLAVSADEVFPINLAYKVGNRNAYSLLQLSADPAENQRAFAFGFGIGHIEKINQRLAVVAELSQRFLYLGHWNDMPFIDRLQATLQWKVAGKYSLYAGPAISYYHTNGIKPATGYKTGFPGSYSSFASGQHGAGWIGWTAGINFF